MWGWDNSIQQTRDGGYIIAGVIDSFWDLIGGKVDLIKTDVNGLIRKGAKNLGSTAYSEFS